MKGFYKIEYFSNRKTCDNSLIHVWFSKEDCINKARKALEHSTLWTKAYIYYLGDLNNNFQEIKDVWKVEITYNELLQPVAVIMKEDKGLNPAHDD